MSARESIIPVFVPHLGCPNDCVFCNQRRISGSLVPARPEDVAQDEEGLQTMRQLARNLLWLLQCIAAGDAAGVPRPETEARKFTNFIR